MSPKSVYHAIGDVGMSLLASDKKRSEDEYLDLLIVFERLLEDHEDSAEQMTALEELIILRSSYLIDRVFHGLGLDFDRALTILRSKNNSATLHEQHLREVLVAAIDNLVDFSAAQECKMFEEVGFDGDIEDREFCIDIFSKYNLTYATQENSEVFYSSRIAAWWLSVPEETVVTFMTQADERVRAWHLSHEGLSFPKSQFPPELIPPIEWGCRCFLITNGFDSVVGNLSNKKTLHFTDPVFSESLATCGRIFSQAHPYFDTSISENVQSLTDSIKRKFYIL